MCIPVPPLESLDVCSVIIELQNTSSLFTFIYTCSILIKGIVESFMVVRKLLLSLKESDDLFPLRNPFG